MLTLMSVLGVCGILCTAISNIIGIVENAKQFKSMSEGGDEESTELSNCSEEDSEESN